MAVATMREGERAIITCTPEYAFGTHGNPAGFHSMGEPIPGEATLIFDFEFLAFDPPEEVVLFHDTIYVNSIQADLWKMSVEDKLEKAKQLKTEANEAFKVGAFEKAFRRYAKVILRLYQAESLDQVNNSIKYSHHFHSLTFLGSRICSERFNGRERPSRSQNTRSSM